MTYRKRLYSLGEEVIVEIDRRLTKGQSGLTVARWIREELKQLLDVDEASVKRMVERYRATDLRDRLVQQAVMVQQGVRATTIAKKLNALDELTDLVAIQQGRFQKLYVLEAGKVDKLDPVVTNEARLLKDMLVQLGGLQLDTGVLPKASKIIKGQTPDELGTPKEFEWSDEQEQLYRELDAVTHEDQAASH